MARITAEPEKQAIVQVTQFSIVAGAKRPMRPEGQSGESTITAALAEQFEKENISPAFFCRGGVAWQVDTHLALVPARWASGQDFGGRSIVHERQYDCRAYCNA